MNFFGYVWLILYLARGEFVIEIEEEEFKSYIKKKEVVMVEVYTADCKECQAMAKEYEKAAKMAKQAKKPYTFVKIDAIDNPEIEKLTIVKGYPTLRLYVNASSIPYLGNRTANDILAFMDKKSAIQSKFLSNPKEIIDGVGVRVSV